MTVTEKQQRKRIAATGFANPLTHDVYLESSAHLKVYADTTLLALGTDYTVSETMNPTGYEVDIVIPDPGSEPAWWDPDYFILSVEPPIEQADDVSLGGQFGLRFERSLDNLARRVQHLADRTLRALKMPRATSTAVEYEVPAPVANKVIGWNATADGLELYDNLDSVAADAAASAAAADASADAATVSATNAQTAQSAAVVARLAAEAALAATLSAYDSFDDRYLGAKASNPTLDNDGNALVAGMIYYNSVSGAMLVYTGSAWVAAYVSGASYLAAANNLSDLANAATARTNLGLAIGTHVQAYSANLDEYAGVNPTAAGLALLDDAGADAQLVTLGGSAAGIDGFKFDFDTVALLIADTVRTYSNTTAGDYIRTRAEGFAYLVAASGASDHHVTTGGGLKLYVLPGADGYNVKAFGAEGVSTDDYAEIQKTISTARSVGGAVRAPAGTYSPATTLTFNYTDTTGNSADDPRGVTFLGDGPQNTIIQSMQVGAYQLVINGGTDFDALIYNRVGGFSMIAGGGVYGMHIYSAAFGTYDDVHLHNFDVGLRLESVLSTVFNRLMVTGGINGVTVLKGTGFSDHNDNTYNSPQFRLGTGWAFSGGDISGINFFGLTIQGWGTHSSSAGGLDLTFTGAEGGVGLNIDGAYFEGNKGNADVSLTNNHATRTVTHTIKGAIFTRLSNTAYVTNNISLLGTGRQRITLIGCHFEALGTYVEDVSRQYVNFDPALHEVVCIGCTFGDNVARGTLRNIEDNGLLVSGAVSAAAQLDIDLSAYVDAGITKFRLELDAFVAAADGADFHALVDTDAGASFITAGYSYVAGASVVVGAAQILLATGLGTGSNEQIDMIAEINCLSTHFWMTHRGCLLDNVPTFSEVSGTSRLMTGDVNAIRLKMSSGNITSGAWRLLAARGQ